MQVNSVTLLNAGQSTNSTNAKKRYSATYLVQTDDSRVEQLAVVNDYRLPLYGQIYAFSGGVDTSAVVTSKDASRESNTSKTWKVEVTWETLDQNQTQGSGGGSRPKKGNQQVQTPRTLTDEPNQWEEKWEWIPQRYTGPLEDAELLSSDISTIIAKGTKGPCRNAAGDTFDPPPERDFAHDVLKLTKYVFTFDVAQARKYKNAINSDNFTITKPGLSFSAKPGTVKLAPITGGLRYQQKQNGDLIGYVEVVYELEVHEDSWDFKIINRGVNRRLYIGDVDDNGHTQVRGDFQFANGKWLPRSCPIIGPDGVRVSVPQLLKFDGHVLGPDDKPTTLSYRGYNFLPFSSLNL